MIDLRLCNCTHAISHKMRDQRDLDRLAYLMTSVK